MRTYIFLIVLFTGNLSYAQEDVADKTFIERSYIGGDLIFNGGNNALFFSIAPFAGYYLTNNLSVGPGIKYLYYNDGFNFKDNIFGGSIFSRFDIGRMFFLHAELETVNTESINPFSSSYGERVWPQMALVGGGIKYSLGGNSFAQLLVVYDLIDDRNSPYRFQYFVNNVPLIFKGGIVITFD